MCVCVYVCVCVCVCACVWLRGQQLYLDLLPGAGLPLVRETPHHRAGRSPIGTGAVQEWGSPCRSTPTVTQGEPISMRRGSCAAPRAVTTTTHGLSLPHLLLLSPPSLERTWVRCSSPSATALRPRSWGSFSSGPRTSTRASPRVWVSSTVTWA